MMKIVTISHSLFPLRLRLALRPISSPTSQISPQAAHGYIARPLDTAWPHVQEFGLLSSRTL